jgi:hypothetical protein
MSMMRAHNHILLLVVCILQDVMGRYEWVATRVRYYRQRTEADKEGESVEGRDQWSSDRRSVRSGR